MTHTNDTPDKVSLRDIYSLSSELRKDIERLRENIEKAYVTKVEFGPVKAIAYTLVGLICTSVLAAILGLVIIRAGG